MIFSFVACDNPTVEPKQYTVTFETGIESKIDAVKVEEGKTVARPEDPVNEGMVLVGWYLGEEEYDFAIPVKADITLKAVWGKGVANEAELNAEIAAGTPIICLTSDITAMGDIVIADGKTRTLDLNGKNIVLGDKRIILGADGENKGAELSVIGSGIISKETSYPVFRITGTADESKNSKIHLTIGKNVTVDGLYAVSVFQEKGKNASYDVAIDIYGTVKGEQPLYVSGNIQNTDERAPKINIHENAKVMCTGASGIYIAGYTRVVIDENAVITSEKGNAINFSAGELEINGAIMTGGNEYGTDPGSGGSISSEASSAIYVKQHTTRLPVKVVVNSGKFNAFVPFFQATGETATVAPKPELVEISIKGGEFTCTSEDAVKISVKSNDKTGFITGGTFSVEPAKDYIAEGYELKQDGTIWTVVKSSK